MTRKLSLLMTCAGLVLVLMTAAVLFFPRPAGAAGPSTVATTVVCEPDGTNTAMLTVTNDLGEGKLKHLAGSVAGTRSGPLRFGRTRLGPGHATTATISGIPGGGPSDPNGAELSLTFAVTYSTNAARYTNNLVLLIGRGCPQNFTRLAMTAVCHNLSGEPGGWQITARLIQDRYPGASLNLTGSVVLLGRDEDPIPLMFSPNPVPYGGISTATTTLPAPSSTQQIAVYVDYGYEFSDSARLTLLGGGCVPAEIRQPK